MSKLGVFFIGWIFFLMPLRVSLAQVEWMDKDSLKAWLGRPEIILLDVRLPQDWATSDLQIKGATYKDPEQVSSWGSGLPRNRAIIVYCSSPRQETSSRIAQTLFQQGFTQLRVLQGGFGEWENAGYPMESKARMKTAQAKGSVGRFLPGDSALVDKLSDICRPPTDCKEEIYGDGQNISFGPAGRMPGGYSWVSWSIWNEKTSQGAMDEIAELKAVGTGNVFNRTVTHYNRTILNRIDNPGEVLMEGIEDRQYDYRHAVAYREFIILFDVSIRGTNDVLHEHWPTLLENAKKLIDTRFPVSVGTEWEQQPGYAAILGLLGILAALGFGALGPYLAGLQGAEGAEPTGQAGPTPERSNVPYTQGYQDRLNQLNGEITDPNLYGRLEGLMSYSQIWCMA